jgi:hypothetical protein
MKVKNINGTSDSPKCPCGTWLRHWEQYSGKTAGCCVESSCLKMAEVGAHVQIKNSEDRSWYIVPLCRGHNNQYGQELDIMDDTELVPATARNKCG